MAFKSNQCCDVWKWVVGFTRSWETESGKVRKKEKSMIITITVEITC